MVALAAAAEPDIIGFLPQASNHPVGGWEDATAIFSYLAQMQISAFQPQDYLPNREEEPNNKSQDRDLRKLAEWIPPQLSEGTPWRECVRSRAWLWYSLEDA